MKTNYFYDLPDELQELVLREVHSMKMKDVKNQIVGLIDSDQNSNPSLFPLLHNTFESDNCLDRNKTVYIDFLCIWWQYEDIYGECIHDIHYCCFGDECIRCRNDE